MASNDEAKNTSILRSGRKRTYQSFRETITGSIKKIVKKPKLNETLDGTYDGKSSESIFKYGNYNRYYGYRNENNEEDKRLAVFKKEWFENKSILDIGSNVGHVSLWIGRNFQPKKIKGVDIDPKLVKVAKKNIVHYIDENYVSSLEESFSNIVDDSKGVDNSVKEEKDAEEEGQDTSSTKDKLGQDQSTEVDAEQDNPCTKSEEEKKQDISYTKVDERPATSTKEDEGQDKSAKVEGGQDTSSNSENVAPNEEKPVISPNEEILSKSIELSKNDKVNKTAEKQTKGEEQDSKKDSNQKLIERLDKNEKVKKDNAFPYNVSFILENYVPAGPQILNYVKQEYHVILCLSVTKWVQLNFGDFGLKLMFKKIYKQLYPGGKLILEPQPYKSYKRRKNLTPEIRGHYDSMELMPEQFVTYLLSEEVGFSKCEHIQVAHDKQGFRRPMYLLTKAPPQRPPPPVTKAQ